MSGVGGYCLLDCATVALNPFLDLFVFGFLLAGWEVACMAELHLCEGFSHG